MNTLTTEQEQQLVEIITEDFGPGLSQAEFTEALLGLLEDVPGFETAKRSTISKLTTQLWSEYHE